MYSNGSMPGVEQDVPARGPRLGIRSGIFDGRLVVQNQLIHAREALDDVELFGVRMSRRVDPASVV